MAEPLVAVPTIEFHRTFTALNPDGTTRNLTGETILGTLVPQIDLPNHWGSLSVTCTITDAANGLFTANVDDGDTDFLVPNIFYRFRFVFVDGSVERFTMESDWLKVNEF